MWRHRKEMIKTMILIKLMFQHFFVYHYQQFPLKIYFFKLLKSGLSEHLDTQLRIS